MRQVGAWATLAILAAALGGCERTTTVRATEPQITRHVEPAKAEPSSPYVPSGTPLTIRLSTALDTTTTLPGEPFTAHVVSPLRANDGSILVPQDAQIWGRVVNVYSGVSPALVLDFSTVETKFGVATLEARLRDLHNPYRPGVTERYGSPFLEPPVPQYYDPTVGLGYPYDVVIRPEAGIYEPENAREISMPCGTKIHLVLTRPIYGIHGLEHAREANPERL